MTIWAFTDTMFAQPSHWSQRKKRAKKVRHFVVYVISFIHGTNKYVHSACYGILVKESDNESVDSDVSDGETDELLAELKKIHRLEAHALDDKIDKNSNEDWI